MSLALYVKVQVACAVLADFPSMPRESDVAGAAAEVQDKDA